MSRSLALGFIVALAVPIALPSEVLAAGGVDLRARADHRYDYRAQGPDSAPYNRLQQCLRLDASLDVEGWFRVHSMSLTGAKFVSRWNDFYWFAHEPAGERPFPHPHGPELSLRRLYLETAAGPLRLQVGALPSYKEKVSRLTLSPYGWVDGVRLVGTWRGQKLELVGGRIGDDGVPSLLRRHGPADFAELEISLQPSALLGVEFAGEYLQHVPYARAEVTADLARLRAFAPEIAAGLLYNLDRSTVAFDLSGQADLLALLAGRAPKRLMGVVNYTWKHKDIGLRGQLPDDFEGVGHILQLRLLGELLPDYGLGWFSRAIVSSAPTRWQVGLRVDVAATTRKAGQR